MKQKRSKEYKNMFRHYKKSILKQAKEAAINPFDYGPGLYTFIEHLKFMRDYYKLGENVEALDTDEHNRLKTLTYALDELKLSEKCFDKYFYFAENGTSGKLTYLLKTYKKTSEAYKKERQEHLSNFWRTVKDESEYW